MFPRKKKENNHKERELPGFVNVTVIIIIYLFIFCII